ncbi:hypothetical protein K445DRAFT_198085 [Daldinia sp. EC12]|nr:hypothetical protein K445DRAFT_198085 [Daldinia sp. EC12]
METSFEDMVVDSTKGFATYFLSVELSHLLASLLRLIPNVAQLRLRTYDSAA